MIPRLDDFLESRAQWNGEHKGIAYQLSWHGRSDYSPEGTWCYYILVTSQIFYPEDWEKLALKMEDKQYFGQGSWHRHWNYNSFPDLDAHGGWTFGEMSTYLGKDGQEHQHVKVGCDYAHAFDRDGGYWEGHADVQRDAVRSIDILVNMFPRRRERCAYCGIYDDPGQFYTARGGFRVHKSQLEKLQGKKWENWLPADAA